MLSLCYVKEVFYMINRKENANKLKQCRLEKDLTVEKVAKLLNVSQGSLWAWESGRRTPRDDTKVMLAVFYGKDVDYLFY